MTKWLGDATEKLWSAKKCERYFLKTGTFLSIDGSPNPINLQGLPQYRFPNNSVTELIISFDDSDDVDSGSSND